MRRLFFILDDIFKNIDRMGSIGVFDSGYGGLTVLKSIKERLPEYDYIYIGDNARTPYGTRSFDIVYTYTLQAVCKLFEMGCHLVILACNTASAKALRTIQQKDLPFIDPARRVLGVIRPSVEEIGEISKTKHIGILGTNGTVNSNSYPIEIDKIYNGQVYVKQHACPMWVPIVENSEIDTIGAEFFIKRDIAEMLSKDEKIDTLLLACTHYPLLINKLKEIVPANITIVEQGEIVAESLSLYLERHPEINEKCDKESKIKYYTTEAVELFEQKASLFLGEKIKASHIVF